MNVVLPGIALLMQMYGESHRWQSFHKRKEKRLTKRKGHDKIVQKLANAN